MGAQIPSGKADPRRKGAIFGGYPGHSKALAIFGAAAAVTFVAEGTIQLPITSCRQVQIGIRKILGAGNAAYGLRRG